MFNDPAALLFAAGVLTGIGLSLMTVTLRDSVAILRLLRRRRSRRLFL